MSDLANPEAYGVLTEPTTLTIQRLLPGPIERIWAYLTQSELRRQWFAAGQMEMKPGSPLELVWRNDELTDPPGERPPSYSSEHRMQSRIIECDPPRKLAFTFGASGDVSFQLDPKGDRVLLTLTHRRLPDRATMLRVAPGWHAHLDVLIARVTGKDPAPFWDNCTRLRKEYEQRLPA
jgi:uncharacterized protein YndB with AHSA1/START domain